MSSLEMMTFPQSVTLFEETSYDTEDGYQEIIERSEVENVVRNLVEDTIEYYETTILRELDDEVWHESGDLPAEDEDFHIPICCKCKMDSFTISARCNSIYENAPDYTEPLDDGRWICRSCSYDGKHCGECGISEKLVKTQCDRTLNFISDGAFPGIYYCPCCAHSNIPDFPLPYGMAPLYIGIHDILDPRSSPCFNCGGNHLPWEIDAPEECRELWNIYGDQYEIDTEGDPSLIDREETQEVKDIKASFKDVMDDFFELSGEISEGKYLTIVDKLNAIYQSL